jgi:hypothetical protein
MVLADSDRISPTPPYSGTLSHYILSLTGLSPSMVLLSKCFCFHITVHVRSYNPSAHNTKVWASPLSLATTYGITIVFFSSGYLDVSVPRVSSPLAGFQVFNLEGSPIRTSTDQRSFATPHSFSQLTTSFVVSESLGIPHTPLFASLNFSSTSTY